MHSITIISREVMEMEKRKTLKNIPGLRMPMHAMPPLKKEKSKKEKKGKLGKGPHEIDEEVKTD